MHDALKDELVERDEQSQFVHVLKKRGCDTGYDRMRFRHFDAKWV